MNLLDPGFIKAIASAGGWVFAALILAAGLSGFFWAVARGKIVSGTLLDRSIAIQEGTVPAINGLVRSVEVLTELVRDQARQLQDQTHQLSELRLDLREMERRGGRV